MVGKNAQVRIIRQKTNSQKRRDMHAKRIRRIDIKEITGNNGEWQRSAIIFNGQIYEKY